MSSAVENLIAAQERAASVRPKQGGFPYFAEALRQAGVSHYHYTVPAATSLYLTEVGSVVTQASPIVDGIADVAAWNRPALIAAIRTDQAGGSTFPQFTQACWKAGVVRYEVDLTARTCTYHGAMGERYVESYARVEIP